MEATTVTDPAPGRSVIRELLRVSSRPGMCSLAGGIPGPSTFPLEALRAALDEATRVEGPTGPLAFQYGPTEGIDELRSVLAERYGVDIGNVLVTSGAQQALHLAATVIAGHRPGPTVATESVTYLGALQAFRACGASIRSLAGDGEGLRVDELAAGPRPDAVYVVPNFANPTGAVLPVDRRRRLATEASEADGFVVVEDDPYGALRFAGDPLPSVGSLGGPGSAVVQVGSSSKILAPGLRVGWLVGPAWFVDAAAVAKQAVDLHTSALSQLVVARLLGRRDEHEAHLAALRAHYEVRAEVLADALEARLGDRLAFRRPDGGMFLWATATDGTDTDALLTAALEHGVAFVPGRAFDATGSGVVGRRSMRLSYATLDPRGLDEAVARLARAWNEAARPVSPSRVGR